MWNIKNVEKLDKLNSRQIKTNFEKFIGYTIDIDSAIKPFKRLGTGLLKKHCFYHILVLCKSS